MPGIRTDGIRTLADFKAKFTVCDETECWKWRGKSYKGRCAQVWLAAISGQASIGQALHVLATGEPMPTGMVNRCTCTTPNCGNPAHRKLVKRGGQTVKGRRKDPSARIRIVQARRAASTVGMTMEIAEAIRASDETLKVLAKRYGISSSYAGYIKQGRYWAPTVHGASVFTLVKR